MDPIAISTATLIAKWAAEGVVKEAAKSAWAGLQRIYDVVRSKLSPKAEAVEVLDRLKNKPTSEARTSELAEVLDDLVKSDPDFAEELRQLVDGVEQELSTASFVTQVKDNAKVGKITNIGSARDVHF